MMTRSSTASSHAAPPVGLHLVGLILYTLLLHFMPHGSMQRCPLIHATLIVNPTFDMHQAHSILILFFMFVPCLLPFLYPSPFSQLFPCPPVLTVCCRMDITPTGRKRKVELTATMKTRCPKTLRTLTIVTLGCARSHTGSLSEPQAASSSKNICGRRATPNSRLGGTTPPIWAAAQTKHCL